MLKILVPFAAGIALADRFTLPLWFAAGAFVLTGLTALLLRSSAALAGMLLTAGFAAAQLRAAEPAVPRGVRTAFEVAVEGIPADRGRYVAAEAVVALWRDPATGRWHPSGDRVMLYADSLTPLTAGERFVCRGEVRPFRSGAESYRRLMRRRGFAGTLSVSGRTLLERLPGHTGRLHHRAAERLARLPLGGDAGAVVRAMAAGDRSGITPELRTAYSRSGLSHLLAVSGLHTGIVFVLINLLLWWLPLLRRGHLLRNLLAAAAVWSCRPPWRRHRSTSHSMRSPRRLSGCCSGSRPGWGTSASGSRSSPWRAYSPGACRSAAAAGRAAGRRTPRSTPT